MRSAAVYGAFALRMLSPVWALAEPEVASSVLPGAYIVEFNDVPNARLNSGTFFNNLTNSEIAATPRMTLDHGDLFNGASFHLADDSTGHVETILDMSQVKNIWPVRVYARPMAAIPRPLDIDSLIAMKKRAGTNDTFPSHVQGGVDKLHAQGFDGTGIKIAVVDTGIDYNHPSLGGCFGPGCKVAFGADLVGDLYSGSNIPIPDADPIDCDGHGTHVAGIIGAEDEHFTGVAPKATLGIYKVFGCPKGGAGSASNDVLIAAFAKAYREGVDVITASIGGVSGWSEDPWAVVVQKIVAAGTVCTLAAGNDGAEGMFYASGAADATGAIAVGSVNNANSPEVLTSGSYIAGGNNATFGYTPAVGVFGDVSLDAVYLSPADGCTAPTGNVDYTGKLVIVNRGTCTFDTKVGNAMAKGAKNVMIVNNVPGTIKASVTLTGVNAGMVEPETGAKWLAALAAGPLKVTFSSQAKLILTAVDNPINGGFMSTFSSWGPTNELYGRPHVSAPGGNILSTYLLKDGGYAVLSGTSMATPYIAGVLGLFFQQRKVSGGAKDPATIRNLLSTTGRPINFNDGSAAPYPYLAPVVQQGSGLVDAFAVLHNQVSVDVDILSLNDTQHFHKTSAFYLSNNGNAPITFSLKHVGAASSYALAANGSLPSVFPPTMLPTYADVTIEPSTVTIKPGQKKRISVTVTPPSLDENRIPVYNGYVAISSPSTTDIKVPYVGVAAAMKHAVITDPSFPIITDSAGNTTTEGQVFSTEGPVFNYRLALGSANVKLDVVSVSNTALNTIKSLESQIMGSVAGFPATFNPRTAAASINSVQWDGSITTAHNVTIQAPDGTYKFIYRALKIFGNQYSGRDYEKWESEPFTIKGI